MSVFVGTNARLFPSNWRPALEEVAWAAQAGFQAIQFHGKTEGLSAAHLGAPPEEVGEALRAANVRPVMEILIFIDRAGRNEAGMTPLEVLDINLPAIRGLGCIHVHWHLAIRERLTPADTEPLEAELVPQCQQAVAVAAQHGFRFAFEHNAPGTSPIQTPQAAQRMLEAVPGLGMTFDLNHAAPDQIDGYLGLANRITMLHVADTPLPEINYHLPLGLGNIDLQGYLARLLAGGFSGAAILEIGGLPKSGGYGRDTDEALIDSQTFFRNALAAAQNTGTA